MSVSDADRRQDQHRTLRLMHEAVGDDHLFHTFVAPTDPKFASVLPTTWRELIDDGLVNGNSSTFGASAFQLTPAGWLRAALLSGVVDTPECRERCTRLAKALKKVIKGRPSHDDGVTTGDAIAAEAKLPIGWVYNAIEARLLGVMFPNDRWDATNDSRLIRVSPTFGLNVLDE